MKNPLPYLVLLFLAAFTLICSAHPQADKITADEIIQKHVSKQSVTSEVEFVTIVSEDSEGTTDRYAILFCTQKNEQGYFDYLIRVVSPKKYAGVGILATQHNKDDLERYFYLPALGKPKRIVGEGGGQNFLGSNFTYEDLMKESPGSSIYTRMPDAKLDGARCFVVRATPANIDPEEEPTYAYRDMYIEQEQFNILKIDFVRPDEEKPAKTLRAHDYNSIKVDGPTMRPLRAEMRDLEEGSVSWLTVIRSRFNEALDPALFTKEGLASWSDEQKQTILGSLNKKNH